MGQVTKIDWCDSSWNPVTGCLHNCEYCYARSIANRFGTSTKGHSYMGYTTLRGFHVLCSEARRITDNMRKAPYPFNFEPTFHQYKLEEPQHWKKPRTVFVCSMADLFGNWVPSEWIQEVFKACAAAPQHRYLFLTKNPARYIQLAKHDMLPPEHWYGYSATEQDMLWHFKHANECPCVNLFVSIEPILKPMNPGFCSHVPADWVIIGAETGNRKGKVTPEKKWIDEIAMECEYSGRPTSSRNFRGTRGGNDVADQNDNVSRAYLKDRMDDLLDLVGFQLGDWNDAVQACMKEVDTAPAVVDDTWKIGVVDRLSLASGGITGIADAIETTKGGVVTYKTVELLRDYAGKIDEALKTIIKNRGGKSDD